MISKPHTAEEKPLLVQYPSWTLKTLRNLKMDPSRIIAGNGFLRRGASTLLTGGTGIGKSVMVEQWAICLAAGLPLLGRIAVPKKCRVFYMGSQNDPETLKRDCASISAEGQPPRLWR